MSPVTGQRPRPRLLAAAALSLALLGGALPLARGDPGRVAGPPELGRKPSISGLARVGELLNGATGRWRSPTPVVLSVQWESCDAAGAACAALPGMTDTVLPLLVSDVGHTVRLRVTATSAGGATIVHSDPTEPVVAARPGVPQLDPAAPPTVSGTPRVGSTLTATTGTWRSAVGPRTRFTWRRCTAAGICENAGAGQTLTLRAGDAGSTFRVVVEARTAAGAAHALSAPTAAVAAAPPPTAIKPANTSLPTITGTARVGRTLHASTGSWTGTQPLTFWFQWHRCTASGGGCDAIAGADRADHRLTAADAGSTLRVQVFARNTAGTTAATSAASARVAAHGAAPASTSRPVLSGTAEQGRRLRVTTGSWSGSEPIALSYRWVRCSPSRADCTTIAGQTGRAYTLTSADVGRIVYAIVDASNAFGSASAESNASGVVTATPAPPPPPPPSVVPIESVTSPDRLIVDRVQFTPSTIHSRTEPLVVRVHVTNVRYGASVTGALVYGAGVPFDRLSKAAETATGADGWAQLTFTVRPTFPLRKGGYVVLFVRVRKAGEPVLAGVSNRRLVSVRIG